MGLIKFDKALAGAVLVVVAGVFFALDAGAAVLTSYGKDLCDQDNFHCIKAGYTDIVSDAQTGNGDKIRKKKVRVSWQNLWPDERERAIVMKINRMNIRLRKGMTIAVPDDMNGKTYMDFAPFAKTRKQCTPKGQPVCRLKCENCNDGSGAEPTFKRVCEQECEPLDKLTCGAGGLALGEKIIIYDPRLLAWAAYNVHGILERWGPGVGGKSWCSDVGRSCRTKVGKFSILNKRGRYAQSSIFPIARGDKKAGGAPVPYFMRFARGYGIHASGNVPGRHASHGCLRVFYDDAVWLNQDFAEIGTTVIVRPYK